VPKQMSSTPKHEWDDYAPIYLEKMAQPDDRNRDRILPAMTRLCADNLSGRRVLDLGCGFGLLAFALEQQGATVVGVDRSKALLAEAKRRADRRYSRVQFVLADAGALPFSAKIGFDLAVCNMVLQDVANVAGTLREASRVSKPGGRGLFSIRHPWTDGWQENYNQMQELRFPLQKKWRDKTMSSTYPPRYHRPLAYYINQLLTNSFTITHCDEIIDRDGPTGMPLALILATVVRE
jgi:SAM-dependent methyltransferase